MDAKIAIGLRIKRLRTIRGYSQERLSEIVDISPNYLSNIERGKENPTLDLLIKLSGGLKVGIHEIFMISLDEEPKALRQRLRRLVSEIRDPDLRRMLTVLEALIH
jgi:transcriptional regulator with XRE-family HTH domain